MNRDNYLFVIIGTGKQKEFIHYNFIFKIFSLPQLKYSNKVSLPHPPNMIRIRRKINIFFVALNLKISFSKFGCHTKTKEPVCKTI